MTMLAQGPAASEQVQVSVLKKTLCNSASSQKHSKIVQLMNHRGIQNHSSFTQAQDCYEIQAIEFFQQRFCWDRTVKDSGGFKTRKLIPEVEIREAVAITLRSTFLQYWPANRNKYGICRTIRQRICELRAPQLRREVGPTCNASFRWHRRWKF